MNTFTVKNGIIGAETVTVSVTVEPHLNLTDMCEAFERFLRACGYYFDGHVKIVDDFDNCKNTETEDGEEEDGI